MKETYSRTKSVWQRMDADERQAVMDYGEKYKAFLDVARTERLAADEIIRPRREVLHVFMQAAIVAVRFQPLDPPPGLGSNVV